MYVNRFIAYICSLDIRDILSETSKSSIGDPVNARYPAVHLVFWYLTAGTILPSALFLLSVKCR